MCDDLVERLRYCAVSDNQCSECKYRFGSSDGSKMCLDLLMVDAADAIESLKHTVEILCGVKINLVRCCECIYHDDESQYHYCRKWRRNCPNDSDFFCKWGKRKDGGQDDA